MITIVNRLKKGNKKYEEELVQSYKEGYGSFILKQGILRWGLPFAIAMYMFENGIKLVLFEIILWAIMGVVVGGIAFGTAMYYYAKKLANKKETP